MRQFTVVLLAAVAFSLAVYDVIAVWRGGAASTISSVLLDGAKRTPAIVLAFGFLVGHLFGQAWRWRDRVAEFASNHLLAVLAVGIALGTVLWRQR